MNGTENPGNKHEMQTETERCRRFFFLSYCLTSYLENIIYVQICTMLLGGNETKQNGMTPCHSVLLSFLFLFLFLFPFSLAGVSK